MTETPVNKSKLCIYRSEMIHTVVWRIYFSETRFDFSDNIRSKEALHLPHVEPRAMVEGIEKPQVDRYNAIWRTRESA